MKRLAAAVLAAALFPAANARAEDSFPIVLTEPGTGVSYTCSVTDPDTMSITIINAQVPEELTDLVIPDTLGGCKVTAIGEKVFLGCEKLTSVTLPSTLLSIGEMAFSGAMALPEPISPTAFMSWEPPASPAAEPSPAFLWGTRSRSSRKDALRPAPPLLTCSSPTA